MEKNFDSGKAAMEALTEIKGFREYIAECRQEKEDYKDEVIKRFCELCKHVNGYRTYPLVAKRMSSLEGDVFRYEAGME